MSRRLASISLLSAWLCASGAMLDLTQVVAWARMFTGYARTETVAAAAKDTFDPQKPCALCRAVSRARDASERHGPAVLSAGSERMVLILDKAPAFVSPSARPEWPQVPGVPMAAGEAEVPVPPPRGASDIEVG